MRKIIILVAIGILLALFILFISASGAFEPKEAENGTFTIEKTAHFYVAANESEEQAIKSVTKMAKTAAEEYAAAGVPSKKPLQVTSGKRGRAQEGDIVLTLDPEYQTDLPNSKTQGYTIRCMDDETLEIDAATEVGLWYGLTDLLQRNLAGETTFTKTVTEAPESAERTLLLDCGRKFYSRDWIEKLIRRMSRQRYTSLQLHFSDSETMRFESKEYPWLNADEYLTFEDLKSICATAREYQIEIIPELDTPGHMDYIVQRYAAHVLEDPSFTFSYEGKTYSSEDEGFSNISNYYVFHGVQYAYNNKGIDISSEVAKAFAWSLIDEYADFFAKQGCTKFGIGGDELFGWDGARVAGRVFGPQELWFALEHWGESAGDTFITYLNDLDQHLREKGYTCRVWNDELYRTDGMQVKLAKDIGITYWTNDYTPMKELAAGGNKIYSSNTDWCYYVIRRDRRGGDIMDTTRKFCNAENIYENWDPRNCAGKKQQESLIPKKNFAGGYFCIWSDVPDYKTQETVWEETELRTWANSAKLWNHDIDREKSYEDFLKDVEKYSVIENEAQ